MKLNTYEILSVGKWVKVKGVVTPKGWLQWKDNDNCQGIKPPGKWREVKKAS